MNLLIDNFKHHILFICMLFAALSFELILENLGVMGAYLPNFIMCIVYSFGFHKPVKIWIMAIGVIVGESFFSTTPELMEIMIISSYIFITLVLPRGGLRYRNFHIVVFILIATVIYSTKILYLYAVDLRPEVSLMIIKMLVTILLFPLFYYVTEKILKRF